MGIRALRAAVYLLVTVQVYEDNVAVLPAVDVMLVDFLSVMDALSTERADMILDAGNLLSAGWQVVGFRRRPLRPVVPQTWVIGRGCAPDQHMSLDAKPPKLEQEMAGLFVAKHPVVLPVRVQSAPVSLCPPGRGFVWVPGSGEPLFPEEHPGIECMEDPTGCCGAMVTRPSPHDGVEDADDRVDVAAAQSPPFGSQFCLDLLYRAIARCDQQFVPGAGSGNWVVPDVPAEEVESFGQVDDARFLLREGQTAHRQPSFQGLDHRFCVRAALAEHHEVVCVSHHRAVPTETPAIVFDAEGLFHAVQRNVRQQRANNLSYNVANMLLEFAITIPREHLRPGYGDGFRGAPLQTGTPNARAQRREARRL